MTRVVGIGGKLASGKDAIADHLVEEHGWVKFGMSDALAQAMYTMNPWIRLDAAMGWKNQATAAIGRLLNRPPKLKPVYVKYRDLVDRIGYVHAKEQSEVREFLQLFGTEVGRRQLSDGTLWTDIMERKIEQAVASGAHGVIVTGVRFPNEVELFDNIEGAETWWVTRPDKTNTAATAAHASENSVSEVDFERCVRNDGTLKDLYRKVDDLVS